MATITRHGRTHATAAGAKANVTANATDGSTTPHQMIEETAMADGARNIKVTLTANVDDYVAGMERAKAATAALADELRACGITEADLPKAIKTAMRIVKDEDGEPKFAVGL